MGVIKSTINNRIRESLVDKKIRLFQELNEEYKDEYPNRVIDDLTSKLMINNLFRNLEEMDDDEKKYIYGLIYLDSYLKIEECKASHYYQFLNPNVKELVRDVGSLDEFISILENDEDLFSIVIKELLEDYEKGLINSKKRYLLIKLIEDEYPFPDSLPFQLEVIINLKKEFSLDYIFNETIEEVMESSDSNNYLQEYSYIERDKIVEQVKDEILVVDNYNSDMSYSLLEELKNKLIETQTSSLTDQKSKTLFEYDKKDLMTGDSNLFKKLVEEALSSHIGIKSKVKTKEHQN